MTPLTGKIPDAMDAIEIAEPGGPEALRPARRPVPVPHNDQILIRIAYAGVNRPDVLQRQGSYRPPPNASDLPGLEAAGEVVGCGAGVTRWRKGDLVTALLPGGGYAEYAVCHQDHAQAAHLSSDPAVAKTRALRARATWIAIVPIPDDPP